MSGDFFITCSKCGRRIEVEGRLVGISAMIVCPQCDNFIPNPKR